MHAPSTDPAHPVVNGTLATVARLAYVIVVFLATLSGLGFDPNPAMVAERLARAVDLTLHLADAVDGVRNIVLFAGLGAVWIATSRKLGVFRPTLHVTLVGCALSTCVESLQLFSPVRHASIIDVTTNTVGTLVGALVVDAVIAWVRSDKERPSFLGIPALTFAATYGVSIMMETFMPLFRQSKLPEFGDSVGVRIGFAIDAIHLSSIADIPIIDVALFLPAGIFAVAALVEFGVGSTAAWLLTAAVGALCCTFFEVFHGVAHLPVQLGAVLTHALSIAAGAWIAARWLPRFTEKWTGARRARVVFIAYCLLIVAWSWRPFTLELDTNSIHEQFSAIHWVPLLALAVRFDLFTVTDVVTQFVLYLPLGALLAVWPLQTRGAWRHLLPAIYLSLVMELGKIVIAERFFDVTHILIQVAGAAMGWGILRHAGYTMAGEVWSNAATNPTADAEIGRGK